MTKALIAGAFDGIHPGHIRQFKYTKEKYGYLTVALNTDEFITRYKNYQPWYTLTERMEIVKSIRYVDEVIINLYSEHFAQVFIDTGATVYVSGSDWTFERLLEQWHVSADFLATHGITVDIPESTYVRHNQDFRSRSVA